MKTISLGILLSLVLFAGDSYAANGSGGTGQNTSGSGVGRSSVSNARQGGTSNGTRSVGIRNGIQRGAAQSSTGATINTQNLSQNDLQTVLQNRTGNNRISFQTNQGTVNLTQAQINQMGSERIVQLLSTLNGNNSALAGLDLSHISDANLRTQLFDLLDTNRIGSQIDIQVRNGVVTLGGFVVNQTEAEQLIQTLSSLNLRNLNLQDSDVRLLSDPGNRLSLNTGTGQLVANPQTGIVTNVPVTPNDLTQIGRNNLSTTDDRAGIRDVGSDPRLQVFGNADPRAGSNQVEILRNFNDPNNPTVNNNVTTGIGTGNTSINNGTTNTTFNNNRISDSDMRLAILDLLDSNGITAQNLVVESNSGQVSLSGFASPLEADRIIQLIRSLNVDQINLNLTLVR
jgi:osmotically-inducible protein OsmY